MGRNNPDLKNEMESKYRRQDNYVTTTRLPNNSVIRPYFKQYGSLTFDIVRSPQQVARWNRLTCSVIRSNTRSRFSQPKIIQSPSTDNPNPVVFKQLRHLPTKSIPIRYGKYIKAASTDEKRYRVREKNWLRRLRARNKKKKKLPPLP
ncbi:hypothetical protein RhiirA4_423836 [Rhizophagus irregularis]|uniref:Uncharacterized protein n=1 Tax=Rhizophagus irregularis TaxID=588596 RepID=A0A2I1GV93_9GLOM|nr:hypothetical protein RhiirA4_423836 [Rhizophagus irregularis]